MEPFVAGPQIYQAVQQGRGEWKDGGGGGWRGQTSGNAPISSDMMSTVMDGSCALFGN